jgi:excinuclease UvrABC nuclease subunit
MQTVKWLSYEFNVHPPETNWNDIGGIYIFTGINARNQWVALYIGQAVSLRDRLADHEQWNAAARLGATHVHAKAVPLQANRDAIEIQLIKGYQPRLNTHHR